MAEGKIPKEEIPVDCQEVPAKDTVHKEQTKETGNSASGTNSSELSKYIKLHVRGSSEREGIHFRLKVNTPMIKLKRAYSQHVGVPADCMRFLFDGRRITDDDTPKKLELVEDDQIEVYQEQIGGELFDMLAK